MPHARKKRNHNKQYYGDNRDPKYFFNHLKESTYDSRRLNATFCFLAILLRSYEQYYAYMNFQLSQRLYSTANIVLELYS